MQEAGSFQQTHLLPNEKFKQVKEIIETSIFNPHPSRWPTEVMVGEGESSGLKLSTGSLAKLADGAAVAQVKDSKTFCLVTPLFQVGGTAVMATVCRGKTIAGQSFLPMTVDFRQKAAAAGRIPTNMLRRELGASEREVKN